MYDNPYPILMLNLKRMDEYKKVSEYDQEIPQSHTADQTTTREEKPQNTKNMERYEHYTDLARSGNTIKQQPSGVCTLTL